MSDRKSGHVCAVKNCHNKRYNCDKKFFSFPSQTDRARVWSLQANREDLLDTPLKTLWHLHKSYRLCEDHFEPRMFTNPLHERLIANAIPTLFPSLEGSSADVAGSDHTYSKPSLLLTKIRVFENEELVPDASLDTMAAIDTELLIGEIEMQRNIWDFSDERYNNRDARQQSWNNISAALISNFNKMTRKEQEIATSTLQKRWKTLKDAFLRSRSKESSSDPAANKRPKYLYHDNLRFLDNIHIETPENFIEVKSEDMNFLYEDSEQSMEEVEIHNNSSYCTTEKNPLCIKSLEERLSDFLNRSKENKFDPDKLFFDSLLSTLEHFNEDQKLKFRIEVLKLIRQIKNDSK